VERDGPARSELGRLGWILGEIQMEMIFKFQMDLEFGMTLMNLERRFRRNFDMRIFAKFF
jgi:hypothetical protein